MTIKWQPQLKENQELDLFLSKTNLKDDAKENIKQSALSILQKCSNPALPEDNATGLVVGYVQSGKTMSFESVITLGKDNGFKIFIVIAGIANPLLEQSNGRLRKDLGIGNTNEPRRWIVFKNPNLEADQNALNQAIEELKAAPIDGIEQQYILITVLKNHKHLSKLAEVIQNLDPKLPTLIIDDEADQASLNTKVAANQKKKTKDESSTYAAILNIRKSLPNHTYLQYTATPQAPLLINKIDQLSPDFVEVLQAGIGYTGGKTFFSEESKLTRIIPVQEVSGDYDESGDTPEAFLKALRVYIIGVAAGLKEHKGIGNRSMLVHPSHKTIHHKEFYKWINEIFDKWKEICRRDESDSEKKLLIQDFKLAYEDLTETVQDLVSFEDIQTVLPATFNKINILQVNASSGKTPEIDWGKQYGFILVGGQALDRGFTVEGLTVTYMPRGYGVGNIDTLQQRARFFGYRGSYIGFCRVYLNEETLGAFQGYLKHEEGVRDSLIKNNNEGRSLKQWKRAFWLDPEMKACRKNILDLEALQKNSQDWFYPRVILGDEDSIKFNQQLVKGFIDSHSSEFVVTKGHPNRTPYQIHKFLKGLNLERVLEDLLIEYRNASTTSIAHWDGIIFQIQSILDEALAKGEEEVCDIYWMSALSEKNRKRSASQFTKQSATFQGKAPNKSSKYFTEGEIYEGDTFYKDEKNQNITIQIHNIDITQPKPNDNIIIAEDVKVLAIWIPERLKGAWYSQLEKAG